MGRGLVGSDAGVPALGEIGATETRGAARAPDGGDGAGASHDEQHRQRGEERTAAREEHLERYPRAPSTVARQGDPSGFPLDAGRAPAVARRPTVTKKNFERPDETRNATRTFDRASRDSDPARADPERRAHAMHTTDVTTRGCLLDAKCAARRRPLPLFPYHIPRASSPDPRRHSCARTRSVSIRRAHAPLSRARMRTPPRFPRAKSSRTVE